MLDIRRNGYRGDIEKTEILIGRWIVVDWIAGGGKRKARKRTQSAVRVA
jgi:hypothetical protein